MWCLDNKPYLSQLPQQHQYKQQWEASHPRILTETCFVAFYPAPNWPSRMSPPAGCLPIPITQLLPVKQETATTKGHFSAQYDASWTTQTTSLLGISSSPMPSPGYGSRRPLIQSCAHLSYLYCFSPNFQWNSWLPLAWLRIHRLHNASKTAFHPRWHSYLSPSLFTASFKGGNFNSIWFQVFNWASSAPMPHHSLLTERLQECTFSTSINWV